MNFLSKMIVELDKHLVKRFNPDFENILEKGILKTSVGLVREIIPEKISKQIGLTAKKIIFRKPTPYHYHKKTKEVFIFHNEGKIILEDIQFNVEKRDVLYVAENMKHKLIPFRPYSNYSPLETIIYTIPFFDPSDEYIIKE